MIEDPHIAVESADDLFALAMVRNRMAAERYDALAEAARAGRNPDVGSLFDALAEDQRTQSRALESRHGARLNDPVAAQWRARLADEEEPDDGARLPLRPSAYQALAFAVRGAEQSFRDFSYIAGQAVDPALGEIAEDLAREALASLAMLRQARRKAFHADRVTTGSRNVDPAASHTHESLRHLALDRERRVLSLVEKVTGAEPDLLPVRAITVALIADLREPTQEPEASLGPSATGSREDPALAQPPLPTEPTLSDLRVELDRNFDLYDRAVERTADAAVQSLAQALASATVARLTALSLNPSD